jgi:hypothetical protein
MAFLEALPLLAEAGEAGAGAAGAAEAGSTAAEAATSVAPRVSGLRSALSGMTRDFNDSQVGKFLGSSQGRMVTSGMQLAHQFDTRAQQQEQQAQQQEQGPVFGG